MIQLIARLALLGAVALGLAGCDKCGDYFWLGSTSAPHSCKEGPAPR